MKLPRINNNADRNTGTGSRLLPPLPQNPTNQGGIIVGRSQQQLSAQQQLGQMGQIKRGNKPQIHQLYNQHDQ